MSAPPRTRGLRRPLSAVALAALVLTTATACFGTWGIRASYRNYVTSPMAGGSITTEGQVTWLDGAGTGKGPFRWTVEWATFDTGTETGVVQMAGSVVTKAHPTTGGSTMDTTFSNPRLEIDGDTGTLIADLNYRPFTSATPGELPPLEAALDVPFATVDLSGVDWTPVDGNHRIEEAPVTGIDAAMELIGWDDFYGTPVTMDPLSLSFDPDVFAPTLAPAPTIRVSRTEGLAVGDTVTVWGTGFDPAANLGTRPPLSGQPAGAYVVLGRFTDPWQPSASAPSANRVVISQRWALPAASRAVLDPTSTNPAFATVDELGRFETTIEIADVAGSGTLGIYTYPGSGAVNAAYELATPITLGS